MARNVSGILDAAGTSFVVGGLTRTQPTGTAAYRYAPGVTDFVYAGEYYFDTGFQDLAAYSSGANPAELYIPRVYLVNSVVWMPAVTVGTPIYQWLLLPSVMWLSQASYAASAPPASTNVHIYVKAFVKALVPQAAQQSSGARLDSVAWALHRT
jgi:hypothetical protein